MLEVRKWIGSQARGRRLGGGDLCLGGGDGSVEDVSDECQTGGWERGKG